MKIAIVGAGAMGSMVGGLLALSGENVFLVDLWKKHVREVRKNGLTLIEGKRKRKISIPITDRHSEVGVVDLVIIFVKSYDTEQAVKDSLPLKGRKTIFLTLQNGLGNEQKIARVVGESRVLHGVTTFAANRKVPGQAHLTGRGKTYIGTPSDQNIAGITKDIAKLFNKAGFTTKVTKDLSTYTWDKLIINAAINPVTAILRISNGELLNFPETKEILRQIVNEGFSVTKASGIKFPFKSLFHRVVKVCKVTAPNHSSMLRDIELGRQTEIESINGAICRAGDELDVATPYNNLMVLMVKALEKKGFQ